jgi:hypothetical protein
MEIHPKIEDYWCKKWLVAYSTFHLLFAGLDGMGWVDWMFGWWMKGPWKSGEPDISSPFTSSHRTKCAWSLLPSKHVKDLELTPFLSPLLSTPTAHFSPFHNTLTHIFFPQWRCPQFKVSPLFSSPILWPRSALLLSK